jgi:hypothetical protein
MDQVMETKGHIFGAFGHHKAATMWVHGICGQVCLELGLKVGTVFLDREFDGDLERYAREGKIDFLLYGNANYKHVQHLPLKRIRGFHYVRDPRDVVASAYFSHRNSHSTEAWPELIEYREKLRSCSKEEGMFLELDFRAEQFDEMRSWIDCVDQRSVRFYRIEDVILDPYGSFLDIFNFMGLLDEEYYSPSERIRFLLAKASCRLENVTGGSVRLPRGLKALPPERLLGIVYERDFSKLSGGRKQGESDTSSHYRRGVHGDWVNHFSSEHLRYFKERYGDLVLQYGYESDPDWDRKYLGRL